MIIFGQGAIRCHPYAYKEVKALQDKDYAAFDKAFWSHIGHVLRNTCRSFVLSVSRGHLAAVPSGPARKYYRRLSWASASFAIMADIAMGTLGGTLKLREKLTGRYADVLSWMYLATAILRRYEAEGYRADHRPAFEWAIQYAFAQIQEAFNGIFANFTVPAIGWLFRGPIAFWARVNSLGSLPSDKLGHELAKAIQQPGSFRDSLTQGTSYDLQPEAENLIEHAYRLSHAANDVLTKITKAVKAGQLPKRRANLLVKEALAAKVITEQEATLLEEANRARDEAVKVDAFALDEFRPTLLDAADSKVGRSSVIAAVGS
jgi:acyl-CoA dehydrogenase